jgi:hypothetical protein
MQRKQTIQPVNSDHPVAKALPVRCRGSPRPRTPYESLRRDMAPIAPAHSEITEARDRIPQNHGYQDTQSRGTRNR